MRMKLRIIVVMFTVLGAFQASMAAQAPSYSGVIALKDGTQIEFTRFEFKGENKPTDYWISGRIGNQDVRYHFHELKRLVFADSDTASYTADSKGDILIEGRTGKQVTVTDAYLCRDREGDTGTLVYRSLDPVTGESRHEAQRIYQAISFIQVGIEKGRLRKNPNTNQFYPASYNFDPVTGAKLIWDER